MKITTKSIYRLISRYNGIKNIFVISFQRFRIYVLAAFASQSGDNFIVVPAVEMLAQYWDSVGWISLSAGVLA